MRRLFLILLTLLTWQVMAFAQTNCRSAEYRQQLLENNPSILDRIAAIESFTQDYQKGPKYTLDGNSITASTPSLIKIPVVVHVLYHQSNENISDAQIKSQIDILNQDYQRLNTDTVNTPSIFRPVAANCGFQFDLAKADPSGYATSGIVRKYTTVQQFGVDDGIKFSSKGGDDAWDRDQYLNIWVGNFSNGILGYASVVGGPSANDGVVVLFTAFGMGGVAQAPYNKGRTTTHEIGHWLNLIHTWGDANCGDDHVADTPPQQAADYGCPSGTIITCNNAPYGNMYSNFMDFTNDACMNLFTNGQRSRMLALFQPGGERYALLSSNALTENALAPPVNKGTVDVSANVKVYPNPTVDWITIQLGDSLLPGAFVELYNQVGQKMISTMITQTTFQLNLVSMSKGVYYIKINNGEDKSVSKLVKL